MEAATATTSTCSNEYSSSIFKFLQLADLLTFKEKFAGAGVTKVEHLQDVARRGGFEGIWYDRLEYFIHI